MKGKGNGLLQTLLLELKQKNPANLSSKSACKLCFWLASWIKKAAGGPGCIISHA